MKYRYIFPLLVCSLLLAGCGSGTTASETKSSTVAASSSEMSSGAETTEEDDIPSSTQEVFAMDTYMTVTAYGDQAEAAVQRSIEEIERLDALWSVGDADSEVSILNENGSEILSQETADLVEESLYLYESTGGTFDITIYPLMEEWGFTTEEYKVPEKKTIKKLLKNVDAGAVSYNADTRQVDLPEDVKIDLGGIAKGYTSSRIMEIFGEYGITSGLVSLGGNVQTYHEKTDGSLWRVAVENPDITVPALADAEYIGVISVADKAVITSGGYERYFEEDGKTYHHILDPKTGYPASSGLISVTIVSDDGTLADGLSTSLFVMGKDKALDYWREHQDEFDAVLIEEDGSVTITAGLEDCYTSDLPFEVAK